jgi:hypothetical protein
LITERAGERDQIQIKEKENSAKKALPSPSAQSEANCHLVKPLPGLNSSLLNYIVDEEYRGQSAERGDLISVVVESSPAAVKKDAKTTYSPLIIEDITMETKEKTTLLNKAASGEKAAQSLNNAEIVRLIEHKKNTPDYIKAFFNGFSDKQYEEIVLSMWEKAKFDRQMKMGGKGRPSNSQETNAIIADDFLCQFNRGDHLLTAGPLCKEITEIIKNFEERQMDYDKPSNFFLWLFDRDKLWEQRHYELLYLKWWCVSNSAQGVDESNLIKFIRTMSNKSETKSFSDYNSLIDSLKRLVAEIDDGKFIPLQYAFSQGETQRIQQLYEAEIVKKEQDIKLLKDELAAQELERQFLKEEIKAKNAQIEGQTKIHSIEIEGMKVKMQRFEAALLALTQNNSSTQNNTNKTPASGVSKFFNG